MTREEAANWFEAFMLDYHDPMEVPDDLPYEVAEVAISALQPVSREQVEKVWPGCEACKDAGLAIGEVQFYGPFEGPIDVSGNMHYCPNCGRPITPVARDRQGKRLEALKDGKGD